MDKCIEEGQRGIKKDWDAVGSFISASLQEIATELGGEELAESISLAAVSDDALPNPSALKMLEDIHPGSAEMVITRSVDIQRETHQRELAESRMPRIKQYGKAVLRGITSINFVGSCNTKKS